LAEKLNFNSFPSMSIEKEEIEQVEVGELRNKKIFLAEEDVLLQKGELEVPETEKEEVSSNKDETERKNLKSGYKRFFGGAGDYLQNMADPTGKKHVRQGKGKAVFRPKIPTEIIKRVRENISEKYGSLVSRAFFEPEAKEELGENILRYVYEEGISVEGIGYEELAQIFLDEIAGLGPIEKLVISAKEKNINEIYVNAPDDVRIKSNGRIIKTDIVFNDNDHVQQIADKILILAGETVNTAKPVVDARLPNARVNVVIPPIARRGTTITLRLYPVTYVPPDLMVETELLTEEMLSCVKTLVKGAANIVIAGATESGKTTTIRSFAGFIPKTQRVITIEDNEELRLYVQYPDMDFIALECRNTSNPETTIDMDRLLKNILRMGPHRIIVGEVRSKEAFSMIKLMNTGHDGFINSLHANNCPDAIKRIIQMILENGLPLTTQAIGEMISSAVDIVIFQEQLQDGSGRRRITEIAELIDYVNDKPILNTIYKFKVDGIKDGYIQGHHERAEKGYFSPNLISRLRMKGVSLEEMEPWIKEE
ncbi:CpaF family protein, partial [Aneurinibacillus thermoaerophilus]|uniref:CpaF family protein n=1 Tax=Aneurinibacillus thermoaerophilus TaxID=143495 RepID=UPI002E1CD6F4|nr:ATPase, T2SS/T4P/T4SS family [Aneurinibacillus thermoaerophilus]